MNSKASSRVQKGNPGGIISVINAWFGLVVVLAVVLALGALIISSSSTPERTEQVFGNVVLVLILATPYIVALLSTRLPVKSRWVVLLPATLISAASILLGLASIIGIIFLPATVLLALATWRSLKRGPMPRLSRILFIAASLAVFALVVAAFNALFLHENPRSWKYVTYEDGTTVWQSVPALVTYEDGITTVTQVVSGGPSLPPGAISEGAQTTSDIITDYEAAMGAVLLVLAWLVLILLARRYPYHASQSQSLIEP